MRAEENSGAKEHCGELIMIAECKGKPLHCYVDIVMFDFWTPIRRRWGDDCGMKDNAPPCVALLIFGAPILSRWGNDCGMKDDAPALRCSFDF